MKFYLGIDGGGTKTRALLANGKGRVIGRGESGPGNYHNIGIDRVGENILLATQQAWKSAGLVFQPATRAFLGLAGVKSGLDQSRLRGLIERLGLAEPEMVQVENDLCNALAGGLNGAPGIAVIAGTGSNALGRDFANVTMMSGGWGWLLDDEGGAIGIALAAMRGAVRSADQQIPRTTLLPSLLAFLGLRDPHEIPERLYVKSWTLDFLAQFAPVVMKHAREGDRLAIEVLNQGAVRLASQVKNLEGRLDFKGKKVPVVLLGGCLEGNLFYRKMVEREIKKHSPRVVIKPPLFSAEEGAIINVLRTKEMR